jgi:hypothetical protein
VVSSTALPLYPQGKSPWYPLGRRLGGPQSRSGRGGEEKNSQPLPGDDIKMNLREKEWVYLTQVRDQWRVLLDTVINLRVP